MYQNQLCEKKVSFIMGLYDKAVFNLTKSVERYYIFKTVSDPGFLRGGGCTNLLVCRKLHENERRRDNKYAQFLFPFE